MAPVRDVYLGRLQLPTIIDGVSESLGDTVEVVGGAVTAGERRARSFPLKIRVRGSGDLDAYGAAQRLRRQARAFFDNPLLTSQGVYLQLAFDDEQDGWLILSGADLEYGKGGITVGDYTLNLRDAYRVAALRSHRPARRIEIADRTSGLTARDVLGTLFSTDFSDVVFTGSTPAAHQPRLFLPFGATDVMLAGAPLGAGASTAPLPGGNTAIFSPVLSSRDGATASYELTEAQLTRNPSDVVAYDRRGSATIPGATDDPETVAGWEELFGPGHELYSTADLPVLQNGLCRVRLTGAGTTAEAITVDRYVAGATAAWVEQGAMRATANAASGNLLVARVVEATPERVVVAYTQARFGVRYAEVYVTLQRGWTGPRIEMYQVSGATSTRLRWVPFSTGTITLAKGTSGGTPTTYTSTTGWNGTDRGDYTAGGLYPYAALQSSVATTGDTLPRAVLMLQQRGTDVVTVDDTAAYGATRKAVELRAAAAPSTYQSVQVGFAEDDGTTWAAARDLARSQLFDVRPVPEVVTR